MHKASFIAIGAVTIGLLALSLAGASAGDYDSGYNSGDTDTVTIGSDPYTGGATQEDYDQMHSIQQGIDDLKQSHDAAPDDSTEADDSSGH
jgi:hypothetical protein